MKKKFLSAIILFSAYSLFLSRVIAQSMEIDWAVKDSNNLYGKGLLCDKDSNIFIYGKYLEANNQGTLNAAGSLLKKFSTSGQLLLMKKWPVQAILKY